MKGPPQDRDLHTLARGRLAWLIGLYVLVWFKPFGLVEEEEDGFRIYDGALTQVVLHLAIGVPVCGVAFLAWWLRG